MLTDNGGFVGSDLGRVLGKDFCEEANFHADS